MNIPGEAVEAAARAMHERSFELTPWDHVMKDMYRAYARAALEAGAPYMERVVEGYEDLEGLPVETVIRTNFGTVREKNDHGYWYEMGSDYKNGIEYGSFPATIIYQPNETRCNSTEV